MVLCVYRGFLSFLVDSEKVLHKQFLAATTAAPVNDSNQAFQLLGNVSLPFGLVIKSLIVPIEGIIYLKHP